MSDKSNKPLQYELRLHRSIQFLSYFTVSKKKRRLNRLYQCGVLHT